MFSFQAGSEESAIAGFRSAISEYHDPIPLLEESPGTAVFPPQERHIFIWNVKKVIEFLVTLNSPKELSLRDLTLKSIMLLALA